MTKVLISERGQICKPLETFPGDRLHLKWSVCLFFSISVRICFHMYLECFFVMTVKAWVVWLNLHSIIWPMWHSAMLMDFWDAGLGLSGNILFGYVSNDIMETRSTLYSRWNGKWCYLTFLPCYLLVYSNTNDSYGKRTFRLLSSLPFLSFPIRCSITPSVFWKPFFSTWPVRT